MKSAGVARAAVRQPIYSSNQSFALMNVGTWVQDWPQLSLRAARSSRAFVIGGRQRLLEFIRAATAGLIGILSHTF
jgi:hypothetical protein